jgi:hypothetical protein
MQIVDRVLGWFKSGETKKYEYGEAKIPIQSAAPWKDEKKFWYKTPVRYNDGKMQIRARKPKQVGWKTVESENLKHIIREQL